MTTDYVLPLADSRATLEVVGGKGASLARLLGAGLPVPPGFHVTTAAYDAFVSANQLTAVVLAAEASIDRANPGRLDQASQEISGSFARAAMPPAVALAITGAYAALAGGDPAVAVRSSATAEDLANLSFAGQHETFLNVRGAGAVLEHVKRCWASLWTARAIGYRAQHGIHSGTVRMAVVVQELVAADAAGILFTANPLDGRRDQALISASWGLGEAIVGGDVTPDTVTLDKHTRRVLIRQAGDKQMMTVRTSHGTALAAVAEAQRGSAVLDDAGAADLLALGLRIEDLYGLPVDVEWTRTAGVFNIVQARPITALREPVTAEVWPLPNHRGPYLRSSIIELLPDPLSPLFATLGATAINAGYRRLAARLFGIRTLPHELFITINGFAYYDFRIPPRILARSLFRMYKAIGLLRSAEPRWREAWARDEATVQHWNRSNVDTFSAPELWRGVRDLLDRGIDHYSAIQAGMLPNAYQSEAIFSSFYDRAIKRDGDPPAVTFLLGFDSAPMQAERALWDLADWCRTRPRLAAYLTTTPPATLAALLATPATQGPHGIDGTDWEAWHGRMHQHLRDYGYAIYDLDFAKPLAADDPRPLLQTLAFFIAGHGRNPHTRQQAAAQRRADAVRVVSARLDPVRRRIFVRLLSFAQRYAPLREDGLAHIGLGWPRLRQLLLELGRRLAQPPAVDGTPNAIDTPDDIFWLHEAEVEEAIGRLERGERPASVTTQIRQRRAVWAARARLTPPPVLPPGLRWFGIRLDQWLPARVQDDTGNVIMGIGASAGQVTASARVLRGPGDFEQMRSGEVLVAAITTPAWTPLFALAGGVVTDVGGPLSHSSIVAREYGIPAVLGTGVATRRIQTGQRLEVDGSAGRVTLLSPGSL